MAELRIIATVINDVAYDQRMIRICSSLTQFGHSVKLIGRRLDDLPDSDQVFEQQRLNMLFNSGPLFYILYNIKLFFILLRSSFDVVHAVDLDTLFPAYLVCKIRGKKLVYDAHEYFTEVPELIHRPAKRRIWLLLQDYLIKRLNNAITVSQSIADELEKEYGIPFLVLRNCPVKEPQNDRDQKENYILYQGALNRGRGLELLIHSMQHLDVNLKIAGSGDLEVDLKQLVNQLELQDKVEFLGKLDPDDLRVITSKAFIGYNLSENMGKSYYYSLNNKFFDYVHAGLPAITNAFPEYISLNEEFECCLFCEHSKDELVKTVNLLLDDKDLYGKLEKNCFLASEVWNWQNEELKLKALYAKLS